MTKNEIAITLQAEFKKAWAGYWRAVRAKHRHEKNGFGDRVTLADERMTKFYNETITIEKMFHAFGINEDKRKGLTQQAYNEAMEEHDNIVNEHVREKF